MFLSAKATEDSPLDAIVDTILAISRVPKTRAAVAQEPAGQNKAGFRNFENRRAVQFADSSSMAVTITGGNTSGNPASAADA